MVADVVLELSRGRADKIQRFVGLQRQGMDSLNRPIDWHGKAAQLLTTFLA